MNDETYDGGPTCNELGRPCQMLIGHPYIPEDECISCGRERAIE